MSSIKTTVSDIVLHPNADSLEIVKILGFQTVVSKGQYGYTNNPKRDCLETLAWEKGHSSGYLEIHNWILTLLPLIQ